MPLAARAGTGTALYSEWFSIGGQLPPGRPPPFSVKTSQRNPRLTYGESPHFNASGTISVRQLSICNSLFSFKILAT
jgi:hypothetical protein